MSRCVCLSLQPFYSSCLQLEDVRAFINPFYIAADEHKAIRKRFGAKSELRLENFLNDKLYDQAFAELKSAAFEPCGSPDQR